MHIFLPLILFILLFIFKVIQIRIHLISNGVATTCMHTDKYAVVRCLLNKQYTLFAIESIHFCPGYTTLYLT